VLDVNYTISHLSAALSCSWKLHQQALPWSLLGVTRM